MRIPIPAGLETRVFSIGAGELNELPGLLREVFPGRAPWIVADENTWLAAGSEVAALLGKAALTPYVFHGTDRLHPDYKHCCELAEAMPENCVPVAVGSGVINDLVKCASGMKTVPYCCVATACSVDGYTSSGAALSVDGFKKTVPCPAPLAVVADTRILARAPAAMAAAGYGDLTTKVVAGADWLIADAVGEDLVRPAIWAMVQKDLRDWLSDPTDMFRVFMGLAATGYAMQADGDSRPASGAEHLMSHVWEMEGLSKDGEEISHGFKVSVGTLASLRLMEYVIQTPAEEAFRHAVPPATRAERSAEIARLLQRGCYGSAQEVALAKFREGKAAVERRELIRSQWGRIGKAIDMQLTAYGDLCTGLRRAKCPTLPEEIGLSRAQYRHGVVTAQLIRRRYTILDLLYEAGLLDSAMLRLDQPGPDEEK